MWYGKCRGSDGSEMGGDREVADGASGYARGNVRGEVGGGRQQEEYVW